MDYKKLGCVLSIRCNVKCNSMIVECSSQTLTLYFTSNGVSASITDDTDISTLRKWNKKATGVYVVSKINEREKCGVILSNGCEFYIEKQENSKNKYKSNFKVVKYSI